MAETLLSLDAHFDFAFAQRQILDEADERVSLDSDTTPGLTQDEGMRREPEVGAHVTSVHGDRQLVGRGCRRHGDLDEDVAAADQIRTRRNRLDVEAVLRLFVRRRMTRARR